MTSKRKKGSFLWVNDITPETKIALKVIQKEQGFSTLTGFFKYRIHNLILHEGKQYEDKIKEAVNAYWKEQERKNKNNVKKGIDKKQGFFVE